MPKLPLLAFALATVSFAQPDTAWLFRYPNSEPLAFFADDTGNVYIAGWSEPSEDRLDALLLKIDSLGRLVWRRTYDHVTAGGAARDDSGNIYVSGNSNGAAAARLFLLKCKADGDTEWVRTYGEPGREYVALGSVAFDDSGNVYICGVAESASCINARVLRYRPNGVMTSVIGYSIGSSMLFGSGRFNILGDGGAYLVLAVMPRPGGWPCRRLTVRLSRQGQVLWERTYRGKDSTWDDVRWSQADDGANIYVTGTATRPDGYRTMKMDSSGKVVWSRLYWFSRNTEGGRGFLVLHDASVYVASGRDTVRLVKYDSLGNQLWLSKCPEPAAASSTDEERELGYGQGYDGPGPAFCCMSVDDSANVYLTGSGYSTYGTGNGHSDYSFFGLLLKYDPRGKLVWATKRPDNGDVSWSGAIVGFDTKGALYDVGLGGASAESGIYVLKYRAR